VQGGWRIAAPALEHAVVAVARRLLDDRAALLGALQEAGMEQSDVRQIFEAASDWSKRLASETESPAALMEMLERVQVTKEGIRVALKVPLPASWNAGTPPLLLEHFFLTKIKRRGVEMRIIVGGKDDAPGKADPTLLSAMARAQRWFEEIAAGRVKPSAEIARREGLQKGYLARLMRLAFVALQPLHAGGIHICLADDPVWSEPVSSA
jgi:site-specific DNA recombinase